MNQIKKRLLSAAISLQFFLLVTCVSTSAQIMYDLPQPVLKKIEQRIAGNTTAKHYILFDSEPSSRYSISVEDFAADDSTSVLRTKVIDRTDRFVKIGEKLVPLITYSDIHFADLGMVTNPDAKNEKRRIGKVRLKYTLDSPRIVFDATGHIY